MLTAFTTRSVTIYLHETQSDDEAKLFNYILKSMQWFDIKSKLLYANKIINNCIWIFASLRVENEISCKIIEWRQNRGTGRERERGARRGKLKINLDRPEQKEKSELCVLSGTKCYMIWIYCLQSICLHIFSLTISLLLLLLLLMLLRLLSGMVPNSICACIFFA